MDSFLEQTATERFTAHLTWEGVLYPGELRRVTQISKILPAVDTKKSQVLELCSFLHLEIQLYPQIFPRRSYELARSLAEMLIYWAYIGIVPEVCIKNEPQHSMVKGTPKRNMLSLRILI